MGRTLRIGTRGSDLAVVQSEGIAARLREATGEAVELVIIRTKGDAVRDRPLRLVGGKGLFTKEIEDALLAGTVDLAVHSMKDMPTEGPDGLVIAGVPARVDPRDALVGVPLADLPEGAVVGTGSARRAMQLQAARPDLVIRGIRGNVETRIGKQRAGEYDAVVLASAGMTRLGLDADITERLDVSVMVPAVGQGALALQCRLDDRDLRDILRALSDRAALDAVKLERAFLKTIEGGCSVPAGCWAQIEGEQLVVEAFLGRSDGAWVRESGRAARSRATEAGVTLARRMLDRLGREPQRVGEGVAPVPAGDGA